MLQSGCCRSSPEQFFETVRKNGEVGEALSAIWPDLPPPSPLHSITLKDVSVAFDDLAATGLQQAKRELLARLLSHCTHPREAAYVAKIIFGDLRTGAQQGVLQAAIALAFGKTLDAIQRCQLLVGDLDEVAVLARNDALDAATFRLFHPIQFMLATPQEDANVAAKTMADRTFWAEDKLDGIRAQVHKSGTRIAIYTRTMDRVDESFPDVVEAIAKFRANFYSMAKSFPGAMARCCHLFIFKNDWAERNSRHAILRDNPLAYIAFDLLYLDGTLLMDQPMRKRRAMLDRFELLQKRSRRCRCGPDLRRVRLARAAPQRGNRAEGSRLDLLARPARTGMAEIENSSANTRLRRHRRRIRPRQAPQRPQ